MESLAVNGLLLVLGFLGGLGFNHEGRIKFLETEHKRNHCQD